MTVPEEQQVPDWLFEHGIVVDYDSLPYWQACAERRFKLPRCRECGLWIHFPRSICPKCHAVEPAQTELSGLGVIYTFTVHRAAPEPFVMALVELQEQDGLRIPAPIIDMEPDAIEIGMPVQLAWMTYEGFPVPAFRALLKTDSAS